MSEQRAATPTSDAPAALVPAASDPAPVAPSGPAPAPTQAPDAPAAHAPGLALVVVAVVVAGVLTQMAASGRPGDDLVYFTVQSALLLGVSTALALTPRLRDSRVLALVRGAATVGSVVSGGVYAVAIAPGEGTGRWLLDEPLAAVASTLQHLVLPVLAVLLLRREVLPQLRAVVRGSWTVPSPPATAALWAAWPLFWAVQVSLLGVLDIARIPYPFLDPAIVGTTRVLVLDTVLLVVFWVVGLLVQMAPRRRARRI